MSCDCLTDAVTGAVKAVEFSKELGSCAVGCAYSSGACVRDTATQGRSRVTRALRTSARAAIMLRKTLSRRRRRGSEADAAVAVLRRASTSRDTDTECGGDVGNQQLSKTVDEYVNLCMSSEWATVVDIASVIEELLKPYGGLGAVLLLRSIGSYIKVRGRCPVCPGAACLTMGSPLTRGMERTIDRPALRHRTGAAWRFAMDATHACIAAAPRVVRARV